MSAPLPARWLSGKRWACTRSRWDIPPARRRSSPSSTSPRGASACEKTPARRANLRLREILAKPAFFVVYAAGLALNMTFTRAWATHSGSGMAAALDYCMRGVGVPMALLVNPISNSLLPEIARLRSLQRMRDALRLIDRTVALTALGGDRGCGFALLFRKPAIALFFQRGSFTAESTRLVAAVFLGMGPSLAGWTLLEITARSLFALNRPWPPVIAAAIPVLLNVAITLRLPAGRPEFLGMGATVGVTAGFLALFAMAHMGRRKMAGAGLRALAPHAAFPVCWWTWKFISQSSKKRSWRSSPATRERATRLNC